VRASRLVHGQEDPGRGLARNRALAVALTHSSRPSENPNRLRPQDRRLVRLLTSNNFNYQNQTRLHHTYPLDQTSARRQERRLDGKRERTNNTGAE
jgi:hypothetical protein